MMTKNRTVLKDEELTVHYGYPLNSDLEWFQDAFKRFEVENPTMAAMYRENAPKSSEKSGGEPVDGMGADLPEGEGGGQTAEENQP